MGFLQPISKRDNRTKGVSLSIGVDGRMYLSQGFKQVLNHTEKQSYFLFYDFTDNRIGVSKGQPDPNIESFTFSAIGEGNVVNFIEDCEMQMPGKAITWLYEGKEGEVYTFFQKGRKPNSFKQEKNGNLERLEGER